MVNEVLFIKEDFCRMSKASFPQRTTTQRYDQICTDFDVLAVPVESAATVLTTMNPGVGGFLQIGSTRILVQLISGDDGPLFSEGPWASDPGPIGLVQTGRPLGHLSKYRLFADWREGRVGRDDRRPMHRWR
eukprot:scaffold192_cov331-Pavlova_lutheri.AAC.4